jgi:hypothetical protein
MANHKTGWPPRSMNRSRCLMAGAWSDSVTLPTTSPSYQRRKLPSPSGKRPARLTVRSASNNRGKKRTSPELAEGYEETRSGSLLSRTRGRLCWFQIEDMEHV